MGTTGQSASIHWFKMWSPGHAIASRRCEVPAGIKERMRSFACAHNYASILEFVGHGRKRHAIHLKYKPCKRRLRVESPEARAAHCFHAEGRAAMRKCSIGRSSTRGAFEAKEKTWFTTNKHTVTRTVVSSLHKRPRALERPDIEGFSVLQSTLLALQAAQAHVLDVVRTVRLKR